MRALLSAARRRLRALADSIRVDTAVMLAMLVVLLAHPNEVMGFICDLLGVR